MSRPITFKRSRGSRRQVDCRRETNPRRCSGPGKQRYTKNKPKPMEKKIVLTGIARSKGKAKAQAMVFSHRFGWAFNHVGNEDGKVLTAGWDNLGKSVM